MTSTDPVRALVEAVRALFILEMDVRERPSIGHAYVCDRCGAKGDKDENGRWSVGANGKRYEPQHRSSCPWAVLRAALVAIDAKQVADVDALCDAHGQGQESAIQDVRGIIAALEPLYTDEMWRRALLAVESRLPPVPPPAPSAPRADEHTDAEEAGGEARENGGG